MAGEVLCDRQIRKLIDQQVIINADNSLVNPGSLDLRLGRNVFRLLGSAKPLSGQSMDELLKSGVVDTSHDDNKEGFYLDRNQPYLFELVESLELPRGISARVFNKSGRGRIGTSVRVLSDGNDTFDIIPAGYKGKLWAETCATAFTEVVHLEKTTMPQIRFYEGSPDPIKGWELELVLKQEPILLDKNYHPIKFSKNLDDILRTGKFPFTVDLSGPLLAYRAKRDNRTLNLSKKNEYNPNDFFEEVRIDSGKQILILYPGDFALIHPNERIRIPPRFAAEISEYSIEYGDMKSHYAGLINPGHGYEPDKISGAGIVFEVRARDIPIFLQHGQPISRFELHKMSETPEIQYQKVQSTGYDNLPAILPVQFKKK